MFVLVGFSMGQRRCDSAYLGNYGPPRHRGPPRPAFCFRHDSGQFSAEDGRQRPRVRPPSVSRTLKPRVPVKDRPYSFLKKGFSLEIFLQRRRALLLIAINPGTRPGRPKPSTRSGSFARNATYGVRSIPAHRLPSTILAEDRLPTLVLGHGYGQPAPPADRRGRPTGCPPDRGVPSRRVDNGPHKQSAGPNPR